MEKTSKAKEIGQRLRRFRQARNLSQQDIADKVPTSPQNISKFEKEGVQNIDMIIRLSEIVGHDLQTDETDQEGTIGEIGKEILSLLISEQGHCRTGWVLKKLFGISNERFAHELFKLEKIGMCVREQYKDWLDIDRDDLFITAKGVITLKNLPGTEIDRDELEGINTYEILIQNFSCYQDYIESRPAERIIRNLDYGFDLTAEAREKYHCLTTAYRANYIRYLKLNYETGIDRDYDEEKEYWEEDTLIPCEGFYYDLLYRMTFNITDKLMWEHDLCGGDEYFVEKELADLEIKLGFKSADHSFIYHVEKSFEEKLSWFDEIASEFPDLASYSYSHDTASPISDSPLISRYNELKRQALEGFEYEVNMDQIFLDKIHQRRPDSIYPTTWFSDEEIKQFILREMVSSSDEAVDIDRKLAEINRLMPETLDYYQFPKAWESNGLAKLVRQVYHLPDIDTDSV